MERKYHVIDKSTCLVPCTEVLLQLASSYEFLPSHKHAFILYYTNLKFYHAFLVLNLEISWKCVFFFQLQAFYHLFLFRIPFKSDPLL